MKSNVFAEHFAEHLHGEKIFIPSRLSASVRTPSMVDNTFTTKTAERDPFSYRANFQFTKEFGYMKGTISSNLASTFFCK